MRELRQAVYGGLIAIEYEHEGLVEEEPSIKLEYAAQAPLSR